MLIVLHIGSSCLQFAFLPGMLFVKIASSLSYLLQVLNQKLLPKKCFLKPSHQKLPSLRPPDASRALTAHHFLLLNEI